MIETDIYTSNYSVSGRYQEEIMSWTLKHGNKKHVGNIDYPKWFRTGGRKDEDK